MIYKIILYFCGLTIIYPDFQIIDAQHIVTVPEVAKLTYKDYRLEPVIIPENYEITIRLDQDFYKTQKFTLENCTIKFNMSDLVTENQTNIRIHYDLDYSEEHSIELHDVHGLAVDVKMDAPNPETKIAVIRLHEDVLDQNSQPYFLIFNNIKGTLRNNNNGFYLSQYQYQNETRYLATTQFESTAARSAFPCFDEPRYKATFDISIIKPRNYTTVLSNTKKLREEPIQNTNLTKVTFAQTPKMSTYLVAFIVSTLENITHPVNSNYSIYFPEGGQEAAEYALNIARKIADDLSSTTGLPYTSLGIPKLSHVAIPDFAAGAMENWGLETYRESVLLWDPKQSTNRNKQHVLIVVAHETSHTWFGDLVTLNWWSETWLNEGFATYFEYHTAANIETGFDLLNQFVPDVVQPVLEQDSISSSQPLSSEATDIFTPDQIQQKFGMISYEKGGAVIRMIEHAMTTPRFLAALRKYLDKHRYNNTQATDIIQEFESEGLPKDVLKSWVYSAGYPVVTVSRVNNNAVLTQQRFLIDDANSTTKWDIPISYATKTHNRDFRDTKPSHWMYTTKPDLVIEDAFLSSNWVVVNIQQTGYYRVDYDVALWENLIVALKSNNFAGIAPINRAHLIDDIMHMARVKKRSYKIAMDVTKYLEQDLDYYPWLSAIRAFKFMLRQVKGDQKLLLQLSTYFAKLSTNIVESVTFVPRRTDSHMAILKSTLVMSWASYLELEACTKPAKQEFASYKANPESYYVNPNIKIFVYCLGIKYGNSSDWDFLYGQFLKANVSSERELILNGLGCSRNETILKHYLQMSLNETSGIRGQDASDVLDTVIFTNSSLAFEFFKNNVANIKKRYTSSSVMSSFIATFASVFTTKSEIDDFKKFITEHDKELGDASGIVAQNAVKTAEAHLKWISDFGHELNEWLTAEKAGGLAIKSSIAILVVSVILVILF